MDQDILFILIVVIAVIANIIKAFRKSKQQAPPKPSTGPYEGIDIDEYHEILDELNQKAADSAKEAEYSFEYNQETIDTDTIPYGSLETIPIEEEYKFAVPEGYSFDMSEAKPSIVFEEDAALKSHLESEIKAPQPFYNYKNRLDLREAIFYNAILERPYS